MGHSPIFVNVRLTECLLDEFAPILNASSLPKAEKLSE
jgi:hypothetical protein